MFRGVTLEFVVRQGEQGVQGVLRAEVVGEAHVLCQAYHGAAVMRDSCSTPQKHRKRHTSIKHPRLLVAIDKSKP